MEDLAGIISQVLSDPQSVQQLQSVAASLGLSGDSAPKVDPPPQSTPSSAENAASGLDLSALSALLGGGSNTPQPESAPSPPGPDLSGISALLGNLSSSQQQAQAPSPTNTSAAGPAGGVNLSALSSLVQGIAGNGGGQSSGGQGNTDLSALTALLRSGQPTDTSQSQSAGPGLPFDMNTLLKLQKAMSSVGANRANVDLLLALKPRLKEHRAKKVDDAIRVMQLIQFLPLIKESGLFGDTESGLGGMLGGLGSGLNNVLGGLLGGGNGGGGR